MYLFRFLHLSVLVFYCFWFFIMMFIMVFIIVVFVIMIIVVIIMVLFFTPSKSISLLYSTYELVESLR